MQAIEFKNIIKKFGDFNANDNISFAVEEGTVHCLLGENGAGKSTLMKILFGDYHKDSGSIFLRGNEVNFKSPLDAIKSGIGMLYQHFMVIDDFTVTENVILGSEPEQGVKLNIKAADEKLAELIEQYHLGLNVKDKVGELSVSKRQRVEILKLLYRNSDIIIFDEPTAVLSPLEVQEFFKVINGFKAAGKTIILITHKLKEVIEVADNVTVLRQGKVVYEAGKNELNINDLATAIAGVNAEDIPEFKVNIEKEDSSGEEFIKVENLSIEKNGIKLLDGLNLSVRSGEIHGIAGVEGNGQEELVEYLAFGDYSNDISLVPDDRTHKGMISEFTIGENYILRNFKGKVITEDVNKSTAKRLIAEYDVRTSDVNAPLSSLSGGNQQKVIMAREVEHEGRVLVVVHPTRGVDIKAAAFLHNKLKEEKHKGRGILVISSDLDELLTLSDRLSIMYKGRIVRTFDKPELNEAKSRYNELIESIGRYMIGLDS